MGMDLTSFINVAHIYGWDRDAERSNLKAACFAKTGDETSYVKVGLKENSTVHLTVPLRNSPFLYATAFKDADVALKFLETKLREYA